MDVFISRIGVCLGNTVIDNRQQAFDLGADPSICDKIGFESIIEENSNTQTALRLAKKALLDLSLSSDEISKIGAIFFVSQNPDCGGIPQNSALLQSWLGVLTTAFVIDLSSGCSGYVQALALAKSFMKEQNLSAALIVTSDQYRRHLAQDDHTTRLLFGDAAAATLLSSESGELCVGDFSHYSDGSRGEAICRSGGYIKMNGRAVYNFARKNVEPAIRDIIERSGLGLEQIDLILLHQGSRQLVDDIGRQFGLSREKVPFYAGAIGNTLSSSIPVGLRSYSDNPQFNTLILCGFGVGLNLCSTILTRSANDAG